MAFPSLAISRARAGGCRYGVSPVCFAAGAQLALAVNEISQWQGADLRLCDQEFIESARPASPELKRLVDILGHRDRHRNGSLDRALEDKRAPR